MFAVQPNGTVGILGGGQLGRMLALAAARLGLQTHIYSDAVASPASKCATSITIGDYKDPVALANFAKSVDVVTYEFENVPAETVEILKSEGVFTAPGARPLAIAQDRLAEKDFVRSLGIGVAPYEQVDDFNELKKAVTKIGLPAILKTRRFGYDGKGQVRLSAGSNSDTLERAIKEINSADAILEGFVPFETEVSVIGARARNGNCVLFDISENTHSGGILRTSKTRTSISEETIKAAQAVTLKMLEELDYIGVLAVEFFVLDDKTILVNEFAPRVHNSGHWTMDACLCDQFEQHIRAVCGWSLGDALRHSDAEMINLIGEEANDWESYSAKPNAAVHLYGKTEARAGRKMGHVNIITPRNKG